MCDCLQKVQTEVWNNAVDGLTKKGKIIQNADFPENGFTCQGLMFSSGKWEFALPMEFKYVLQKKDGSAGATRKYKTNFLPTFCPICGKKIIRK